MRQPTRPLPRAASRVGRRLAAPLALHAALQVACGAALLASATPAHAQFGKLVKRATEAAAGAAAGRVTGAAADRVGEKAGEKAGIGGGRSGASSDGDRLEITAERLDAFLVAMRGPVEAARQRAAFADRRTAWEKAAADHKTRKVAYEQCQTRVMSAGAPTLTAATAARQERLSDMISAVADQAVKAQEAGNTALVRRLADSSEVLRSAMTRVLFPALAQRCGAEPLGDGPPAPTDEAPDRNGPAFRPAVPAGMTARQFGTLRERVAAWLIATDRRYVYAPAELQALESRRAALDPLAPLFRGDHLVWGSYMHGLGKES
jgi:hypothetical protein